MGSAFQTLELTVLIPTEPSKNHPLPTFHVELFPGGVFSVHVARPVHDCSGHLRQPAKIEVIHLNLNCGIICPFLSPENSPNRVIDLLEHAIELLEHAIELPGHVIELLGPGVQWLWS